jgi:hypothetical protein
MIYTAQIPWRSPCGRDYVEERSGLFWGWLDGQHVATQFSLERARKVIERKMGEG